MDKLGFCEAWFGEHHSTGWETIGSPELMIAAAAELTRRIRLGTGVIWLPFHNPLMVANRIVQLDHMTMGRAMFGVGPGPLPTDAMMLGIDIASQRDRMVHLRVSRPSRDFCGAAAMQPVDAGRPLRGRMP